MKHLLLLFFLCVTLFAQAQNLVPNPSFEDTVTLSGFGNCPTFYGYHGYDPVKIAKGWSSFGQTPDYFNSCDKNSGLPPFAGVPANPDGYQRAATGNAYCGIYIYAKPNYREFVGSRLIASLSVGTKYYVSLKVSLANLSNCASNNIGVLFSTVPYNDSFSAPIKNFSQVHSALIISDTLNWKIIKGTFIADSAFSYVIVGNFFEDSFTDTTVVGSVYPGNPGFAFYYVDDICVTKDSLGCDLDAKSTNYFSNDEIKIYPNPASDKIFVNSNKYRELECFLFNSLGERIKIIKNDSVIDATVLPNGIYFLEIKREHQLIFKKQIIIH